MPIFLKENQELDGNLYQIPDNIHKHLMQTLSALNQYKTSKGYKRLNRLLNPNYNKRLNKKGKQNKGVYLTYGDLKKIDYEFRHMSKNPNNVQRLLNGGDEMFTFVRDLLNQERTKVNKSQYSKDIKPPSVPKSKTEVPQVKEVPKVENKIKSNKIIKESNDDEYHPYFEKLNEYDTYYVLESFENKENIWTPLINPEMYKNALSEFTKYGSFMRFPTKYIYQWFGIIMKNTAILRTCTDLCGHSTYFPIDDFVDFYFNGDYDEWEKYKNNNNEDNDYYAAWDFLEKKGFDKWNVLPDGSDALSDFGLEPIEKIINEYNRNLSPEKVIVLINKILDVTHQRGDLASIFIDGGSKSLTKISEERKIKKIYIKENKLNLLNNI